MMIQIVVSTIKHTIEVLLRGRQTLNAARVCALMSRVPGNRLT